MSGGGGGSVASRIERRMREREAARKAMVAEQTHVYIFTFYEHDKDNVLTMTSSFKTRKLTRREAGDELLRVRVKYFAKNAKYVLDVQRNGFSVHPKELK